MVVAKHRQHQHSRDIYAINVTQFLLLYMATDVYFCACTQKKYCNPPGKIPKHVNVHRNGCDVTLLTNDISDV